jgi:hypothetical protein
MIGQNARSIGKRANFGGLEVEIVPIGTSLRTSGVRHREHVLWNTMTISTIGKLAVHCINANIFWVKSIGSH